MCMDSHFLTDPKFRTEIKTVFSHDSGSKGGDESEEHTGTPKFGFLVFMLAAISWKMGINKYVIV